MTTPVLEAANVHVERSGVAVLRGVSFAVDSGDVYGLLGGNGAGKSTTLLTFLGFLTPSSGEVRINGRSVHQDLAAARRSVAYLPETAALYEHLSARENLRYFLQLAGAAAEPDRLDAALDQVALDPARRDTRLAGYSKGMRQKVAIALALLRGTDILLLDEPTSGLDPQAIDELHDLVRGLADSGKSILMVTHDVYGACQVADRIGLLRDGQLAGEFAAPAGGRIETDTVHRAFSGRKAAA